MAHINKKEIILQQSQARGCNLDRRNHTVIITTGSYSWIRAQQAHVYEGRWDEAKKKIMATQALAPMRMLLQKEVPCAHCQGAVYTCGVVPGWFSSKWLSASDEQ